MKKQLFEDTSQSGKITIICSEKQEEYIRKDGCIACDDDVCDCQCNNCVYDPENIEFKREDKEEKLKEIIIDLRVALVKARIPYGHCPYAYYSTSKHENRADIDCNEIDCDECHRQFLEDMREDIKEEVMNK